ncbi:MAG: methyltransferase domain-containing protein [Alphaproteobacteria bacterium]|nr:methyltransferase domain-containing protein [Alphaproteobacteria bacterium]
MACLVCGQEGLSVELDVGAHPVSTFFLKSQDALENAIGLRLGQCAVCGTIQLVEPVPHTHLIAPYDWIFSREPEEHLDDVAAGIVRDTALPKTAVIAGLSYKDDTTIERFRTQHGFEVSWRVDLKSDLDATDANANIETVQKRTKPETMANVAERHGGPADLLIVRHIIEHAENLRDFIHGCAALVKPGGYIMVECPDCTKNLMLGDICMVWEEHSLYFTPATFENVMSMAGFNTISVGNYPLPFENCLVIVARKMSAPRPHVVSEAARAEIGMLKRFAAQYAPTKRALRAHLERVREEEGPIAIFGAGHLACAFLLYYGLSDLVEFVADDTPQKQGLYLPGARIPILPSAALVERGVKLCLFAVSPNSEDKIAEKNAAFPAAGGRFASILAASKRSIRNAIAD